MVVRRGGYSSGVVVSSEVFNWRAAGIGARGIKRVS